MSTYNFFCMYFGETVIITIIIGILFKIFFGESYMVSKDGYKYYYIYFRIGHHTIDIIPTDSDLYIYRKEIVIVLALLACAFVSAMFAL